MWISTNPFQLGQYVCYDLNKVFALAPALKEKRELYEKQLNIPADSFLYSRKFAQFKAWKLMKEGFQIMHKYQLKYQIDEKTIANFIGHNPEYWETYFVLGNYYDDQGDWEKAKSFFLEAAGKEITTVQDKEAIEKQISLLRK